MRDGLIKVLDLLSSSETVRVAKLADELGVTTKTVRNEIKEINETLASESLDQIEVNKGVITSSLTKQTVNKLLRNIDKNQQSELYMTPEQRTKFILLEFMSTKEPLFLVDLQDAMQISKSTMDSDMREVRKIVQPYGLHIRTNPRSGVSVEGSERAIRMMFADVFTQQPNVLAVVTQQVGWPKLLVDEAAKAFPPKEIRFLRNELKRVFAATHLGVNDNYQSQAIVMTLVWLSRVTSGNYVNQDDEDQASSLNSRESEFVSSVITHFSLNLAVGAEVNYLAFTIGSFDSDDTTAIDNWARSQVICISLIDWMEESLGFPFSKSETLFERVYKHVSALLRRQNQRVNAYNPLKSTIMQSYPEVFRAVRNFFWKHGSEYRMSPSDDEIGYLAVYFSTAQVEIRQERVYTYRIAVVCNYGMATGRLLAARLEEHFNVDVIAVLSISELDVLKKLPVSLVFKTVDVAIEGVPSLKLNPIPSDNDIKKAADFLAEHSQLSKYKGDQLEPTRLFNSVLTTLKQSGIRVEKDLVFNLQRVFEANKLEINEREVQPMLKDLVNDKQIQLQVPVDGWKDAIIKAAQPLIDEDFIKQSYVQAMIDSVTKYGPYIVIGPSIALAHARPEDGANKLGVSIMTLKDPVNFGNPENDPVKVVFCLAAVDNYSHLNVMKAVVQLINDPKKVEQLSTISDVKEFRDVLFENEQEGDDLNE
ncbi:BglG family transcription antiterminator [Lacticaseibacillus camelliae]|uniref:BglG family transcription antiterminator n=1 Tax=Lacticaseibacillus camelliae TaxID=381742 RepID=UPI00070548F5|nr:BglG family transcription antiterminator [Lacticaseibacillus camelliae]